MISKVDLAMWAKNGASILPVVLKRAETVIPNEIINKKILVDDHSVDETREIARDFGWSVYPNERGGVGSGANTALRHVESDYFVSLEQDVVLAENWFERIVKHLERKDVAVAQGWRITDHPVLGKIEEYSMERFKGELHSIDNNIYKTKIIKSLGGFPEHIKYTGADPHLRLRVLKAGFKWITDTTVISVHLRKGALREQMRRHYDSGLGISKLAREELFTEQKMVLSVLSLSKATSTAFFSPLRGLEIALKKRSPQVVYYYPLLRFSFLAGSLRSRS